jgi:hypothetical protein
VYIMYVYNYILYVPSERATFAPPSAEISATSKRIMLEFLGAL